VSYGEALVRRVQDELRVGINGTQGLLAARAVWWGKSAVVVPRFTTLIPEC
jgi:hypothetical protein